VTASWDEVLTANIVGTRNIFEAAREFQVPRLVFASTDLVRAPMKSSSPTCTAHPTRANDNFTARSHSGWLVHRDLAQLVEKSLTSNVAFGIYYGVSNNRGALWDITNAQHEVSYEPMDDASTR